MTARPALALETVGGLLGGAAGRLAAISDCARLEAELLLAAATGLERAAIMAHPERAVSAAQSAAFARGIERRSRQEPLAYILGFREFHALRLAVDARVLVPRPETEILVELVLELGLPERSKVLDLGTGSGAIALALKQARGDLELTAVDRSAGALELAARNGAALGLAVDWRQSNWFSALGEERFDLIVCNPPYVPSHDPHFCAGLAHEPRLALDGGADGLSAYRKIMPGAPQHLAAGGLLVFEHGYDQREELVALAAALGFALAASAKDLAGHPRAVALKPVDGH